MVKVHVLGYWGSYPGPGEATTGFLVESGESRVLIDCGSGVLAQLFKICPIADLTAVIVTHHHHDHTADLGVLGYAVLLARITQERTEKLPIYMPRGPQSLMKELSAEPLMELHEVTAESNLHIAGLDVSFARTVHAVYCLAVRMDQPGKADASFVFSADSSQCDELGRLAQGARLFLCEGSMYDGQEETAKQTGHLTAAQAGALAKSAGVQELALTHYPHYGDIEDLIGQASAAFGKPAQRVHTLQTLVVE